MARDEALERDRDRAVGSSPASGRCDRPRPARDRRDGDRQHDGGERAVGGLHRRVGGRGDRPRHGHRRGRAGGARSASSRRRWRVIGRTRPIRSGSLAAIGGLEIAVLVGVIAEAAVARIPVVLDGFISGSAALVAVALEPGLGPRLIAGHRSSEPGHRIVLDHLGLDPILDLDLRLGEASGAALAMGVIVAAVGDPRRDGHVRLGGDRRAVVTTIVFVRHAATSWTGVRYCGRSDPSLSERWPRAAEELAIRLAPRCRAGSGSSPAPAVERARRPRSWPCGRRRPSSRRTRDGWRRTSATAKDRPSTRSRPRRRGSRHDWRPVRPTSTGRAARLPARSWRG